jgi:hypothetical protein
MYKSCFLALLYCEYYHFIHISFSNAKKKFSFIVWNLEKTNRRKENMKLNQLAYFETRFFFCYLMMMIKNFIFISIDKEII